MHDPAAEGMHCAGLLYRELAALVEGKSTTAIPATLEFLAGQREQLVTTIGLFDACLCLLAKEMVSARGQADALAYLRQMAIWTDVDEAMRDV